MLFIHIHFTNFKFIKFIFTNIKKKKIKQFVIIIKRYVTLLKKINKFKFFINI